MGLNDGNSVSAAGSTVRLAGIKPGPLRKFMTYEISEYILNNLEELKLQCYPDVGAFQFIANDIAIERLRDIIAEKFNLNPEEILLTFEDENVKLVLIHFTKGEVNE